jgi:hypothetical protein
MQYCQSNSTKVCTLLTCKRLGAVEDNRVNATFMRSLHARREQYRRAQATCQSRCLLHDQYDTSNLRSQTRA